MKFLNKQLERDFRELILKDNTHPRDMERHSFFYILSGNIDLINKCSHIYDFNECSIKPKCLNDGRIDFCTSSKALIRLGFNLYNGYEDEATSPRDILYSLDDKNYRLAIEAANIRFGSANDNQISLKDLPEITDDYELSL